MSRNLKSSMLCAILDNLDKLKAADVKKFTCEDFTIEFEERVLTASTKADKIGMSPTVSSDLVKAQTVERDRREVESQLRRKEDMMQELLLTDPQKYEEMLDTGELGPIKDHVDTDGEDDGEETHTSGS